MKVSQTIERSTERLRDVLRHIGTRTFYILTFHFLMYRPASLLKAYIYDLDWGVIGSHPVIHTYKDNYFWIIYTISSIALCLLAERGVSWVKAKIGIKLR
ncbi:MAG: hypothetical protein II951_11340 [Bacteroidales bacterium]|nr:hypothetical protein [Bacteroidales bacterium]